MPESAALRVGTLMLGVRELGRAVAFYRDALGFSVRFASEEPRRAGSAPEGKP
jgi:catechol 2,3-dioxygenase-like lactoylglutathione lyase family enzyme